MKQLMTLLVLFLLSTLSYAQSSNGLIWRNAVDTLTYPRGIKSAKWDSAYVNGYYSVRCFYQKFGSTHIYSGYKLVCIYNGYYTDDATTYKVFFNKKCQRVEGVSKYVFKRWTD